MEPSRVEELITARNVSFVQMWRGLAPLITVWPDLANHKEAIKAIHDSAYMNGVNEALSMARAYDEMTGFAE